MLIFLFSILLICFGVYYCTMNQKLSTQKTQLRISSKQNRDYKSKISSLHDSDVPIVIKYKPSLFRTGTTKSTCSLYLSPLETSQILSTVIKDTCVEIKDCAEILNISWYEVTLKSQTNINNKGWIKKDVLITLDDTVNNHEETIYEKSVP
ncbi:MULTISPECIES: hypothetical protein [Clostridium]|uniref:SH3 domain-containing protein n=1 Tax=Clostridium frigoriphilum TaxID=443253 RepID=A0ABU7USV9_9CLOT|nr:hypothetical protein [Clostridium sp. DSM 17811]MBU3100989.1 hypothetical protein [Clostridium sp. DSM 17811]